MTKYSKQIILTLAFLVLLASPQKIAAYIFEDDQFYLGDMCISIRDNLKEFGTCTLIERCPIVFDQMKLGNNNYTVCAYEGDSQVVCCPNKLNTLNINLTLSVSVDCNVTGTGEAGVIKFKNDCDILNKNINNPTEEFCDHDICKDLVCCPIKLSTRLKHVCSHVDMPANEVALRLHLNQECVVKGTNMKGRYQRNCDYATRNPEMMNNLQSVCNDISCKGWYCCPIEEPHDRYHCERKIPLPNVKLLGPKCIDTKTGQTGRCRSTDDCFGFTVDEILKLDNCGHRCCLNYYCCPDPVQDISNQPLHVQKCWEYSKFVNKRDIEVEMNLNKSRAECSPEVKPVGGSVVEPGEFPHIAALGYVQNGDTKWSCGGSLISDEYVLTAAHCLVNNSGYELKKIQFGIIDLIDDIEVLDCPEIYHVLRIIQHPDYNRSFAYNDIGLIQLDRKVNFNYHIRPICLPSSSNLPERFQAMGWGIMGIPKDEISKVLTKVDQELVSHNKCREFYNLNPFRKLNKGLLEETQLCAGSKFDKQGTCQGDSGGPLIANHPRIDRVYEIYGIISTGTFCGFIDNPGIYTKVFPFTQWIESIVFAKTG